MMNEMTNQRLDAIAACCEQACRTRFDEIDAVARAVAERVLQAFGAHRVSAAHLNGSTGYGYDDMGRDTLDRVFASALGAQDALVRHSFVSGTHTLTVALFGLLRTGDRMVSITGSPYDTMEEVIGIRGSGAGSLKEYGIAYEQVDLQADGTPDYPAIAEAVKGAKVAYIQRSRGYALRPSLSIETIARLVQTVKAASTETIVFVDNCYGEFVEEQEPTMVGADLMAGSLIKNPGGGIAKTGGYIAGRSDLVELCGYRATAPGIGREAGCSLDENRNMYLGLFYAPTVVAAALKTATFASALYEKLGFTVRPRLNEPRYDLITAIELGSAARLTAFCRGIQKGSPVDAYVTPEAWAMPGYGDPVIMAAGTFTLGASIELSADGPIRPPYAVWLQGGLTYETGRIGVLLAARSMAEEGLLSLPEEQ
jgi:cystathionine beta-lyase family protein involved in aluminum resistance